MISYLIWVTKLRTQTYWCGTEELSDPDRTLYTDWFLWQSLVLKYGFNYYAGLVRDHQARR